MAKGVTLTDVMGVLNQIKASLDKGRGSTNIVMGASAEPQQKGRRGSDPIQILRGFERKLSSIQHNVSIISKQRRRGVPRGGNIKTETIGLPMLSADGAKSVKEISKLSGRTMNRYNRNIQSLMSPFVSISRDKKSIKSAQAGADILNGLAAFLSSGKGTKTINVFGKRFTRNTSIIDTIKQFNKGKKHIKKLGRNLVLMLKPFEKVSLEKKRLGSATILLEDIASFLNAFGSKSAKIARKLKRSVKLGLHKNLDIILFGHRPGGGLVGSITKLSGRKKRKIMKGLGLLALITSGVGVFASAMALTTPLLAVGMLGAAAFGLSILAIGGSLLLLGKLWKPILKGVGMLSLISLGTMLFSLSLGMTLSTFASAGDGNVGKAALYTLLFVGSVAAIGGIAIGLGAPAVGEFALLGSVVLTIIGAGVMMFGAGISMALTSMKGFKKEDTEGLGNMIVETGSAFAKVGLMSMPIMLGIGPATMMGMALSGIAKGIKKFSEISKSSGIIKNGKISEEFTSSLTATITMIGGAFAAIGSVGQIEKRFLGFRWNKNAAKEGINAVKDAGDSLISIAQGLEGFAKLTKNGNVFDARTGMLKDTFLESVKASITGIGGAFAAVGSVGQIEKRFLGFRWNKNAAEEGIDAVKGVGKELIDIANGLEGFAKLAKNSTVFTKDGGLSQSFQSLVTSAIVGIGSAFASIGNSNTVEKGWFVFKWNKNATKEGIDAVKGVGTELNGIVDGLTKFIDLTRKSKDIFNEDGGLSDAFKNRLTTTISSVGDAFASIADQKMKKSVMFISWDKSKVAEGIKSVNGVDTALNGIVDGLVKFADLAKNPLVYSKEGGFNETFKNFVKTSIGDIGEAFAIIGGKKASSNGIWGKWFGFEKNAVNAGVKIVNGVNKELKNLATTYTDIANTIQQSKGSNPGEWLTTQLMTTISGFEASEKKLSQGKKYGLVKDMTAYTNAITKASNRGVFKKQSEGVGNIQKAVNGINEKKLKLVRDLYKAMGDMASGDPNKIVRCCKAIENSLNAIYDIQKKRAAIDAEKAAMEKQRQELEKLKAEVRSGGTGNGNGNGTGNGNGNDNGGGVVRATIDSTIDVTLSAVEYDKTKGELKLNGQIKTS